MANETDSIKGKINNLSTQQRLVAKQIAEKMEERDAVMVSGNAEELERINGEIEDDRDYQSRLFGKISKTVELAGDRLPDSFRGGW